MSNINPKNKFIPSKHINYPVVFPTEKWIRIYIKDILIAESSETLLLLDGNGRQLIYFFKIAQVKTQYFIESDYTGKKGMYRYWHIKIGEELINNGAFSFNETASVEYIKLLDYIGFKWDAITAIFEEEEQLIGHPRNPYHRIDTRTTSKLIQFKIGEKIIAESTNSIALFETDFSVRYYVPVDDVKMDYFYKSKTTSICPYKGIASYWSVIIDEKTFEDVAWSYPFPLSDAVPVKGYFSFWNVDVFVDGNFRGNY